MGETLLPKSSHVLFAQNKGQWNNKVLYEGKFKGGKVHNSKLKRISIALCMALVPISVFAAGLGKLNVMSGLGEPLKADIELIYKKFRRSSD